MQCLLCIASLLVRVSALAPPATQFAGWPPLAPASAAATAAAAGTGEVLALCGYVRSARSLGRNLAFVDVADGSSGAQALLKCAEGGLDAPPARYLLARGARVAVRGAVKLSPRGTPVLEATAASLVAAAPTAKDVLDVLAAARSGALASADAAAALAPDGGLDAAALDALVPGDDAAFAEDRASALDAAAPPAARAAAAGASARLVAEKAAPPDNGDAVRDAAVASTRWVRLVDVRVRGRRRSNGVVVLDLCGNESAVLHPALIDGAAFDGAPIGDRDARLSATRLAALAGAAAAGSRVTVAGYRSTDGGGIALETSRTHCVLCRDVVLTRAAASPRAARAALDGALSGVLPEATAALGLGALPDRKDVARAAVRAATALRIAEAPPPDASSLLDAYEDLRARYPVAELPAPPPDAPRRGRRTGGALVERGRLPGGSFAERKYPQIDAIGAALDGVLATALAGAARPIDIVDIGGSRGRLAFALAERYGAAVRVTLVDRDPRAVATAEARRPSNARTLLGDAAALAADGAFDGVDAVVALHACGGLSDLALAVAARARAAFVVCPCCFLSNRDLLVAGASADAFLGDALKPADLGGLLRAAEDQSSPRSQRAAMHTVNAARARAAEARGLVCGLAAFDADFSQRNLCLVGGPPAAPGSQGGHS